MDKKKKTKLTPVKAIRKHCLDCSCNQPSEVKNCNITHCHLYPYRMGKNPNRKGIGNISLDKRVLIKT